MTTLRDDEIQTFPTGAEQTDLRAHSADTDSTDTDSSDADTDTSDADADDTDA